MSIKRLIGALWTRFVALLDFSCNGWAYFDNVRSLGWTQWKELRRLQQKCVQHFPGAGYETMIGYHLPGLAYLAPPESDGESESFYRIQVAGGSPRGKDEPRITGVAVYLNPAIFDLPELDKYVLCARIIVELTIACPILGDMRARTPEWSYRGTSAKVGIEMLKALPEACRGDDRYRPLVEDLTGELRMWREEKQRAEQEEEADEDL